MQSTHVYCCVHTEQNAQITICMSRPITCVLIFMCIACNDWVRLLNQTFDHLANLTGSGWFFRMSRRGLPQAFIAGDARDWTRDSQYANYVLRYWHRMTDGDLRPQQEEQRQWWLQVGRLVFSSPKLDRILLETSDPVQRLRGERRGTVSGIRSSYYMDIIPPSWKSHPNMKFRFNIKSGWGG